MAGVCLPIFVLFFFTVGTGSVRKFFTVSTGTGSVRFSAANWTQGVQDAQGRGDSENNSTGGVQGTLMIGIMSASNIRDMDTVTKSTSYARVRIIDITNRQRRGFDQHLVKFTPLWEFGQFKTLTKTRTLDPEWNELFLLRFDCLEKNMAWLKETVTFSWIEQEKNKKGIKEGTFYNHSATFHRYQIEVTVKAKRADLNWNGDKSQGWFFKPIWDVVNHQGGQRFQEKLVNNWASQLDGFGQGPNDHKDHFNHGTSGVRAKGEIDVYLKWCAGTKEDAKACWEPKLKIFERVDEGRDGGEPRQGVCSP